MSHVPPRPLPGPFTWVGQGTPKKLERTRLGCDYCGREVARADKYGNCIGCGAPSREPNRCTAEEIAEAVWNTKLTTNSIVFATECITNAIISSDAVIGIPRIPSS